MTASRNYSSPRREADAASTRARIVDAAAMLFTRDGYVATPLKSIAEAADVSVQSVHLAGPKSALLLAAFERTFAGDEGQHSFSERPAMQEIAAMSHFGAALQKYVALIGTANERAAGIWRAFTAAADADPVVREAAASLEQRRRADMRLAAGLFVHRGVIPPASVDEASVVLGFITAPASYLYFVEDSGWSRERYEGWMLQEIAQLVARSADPAPPA
jgi:AcrR family transcriptional regulator